MRFLALLLLLVGCRAPAPPATVLPVAHFNGVAEGHRRAQRLVGLGVGVVVDGRVAYLGGFGEADHEAGRPFDPQRTRVRWASLSKPLTGVLAARLHEQGHLDLDAKLSALLPGYPGATRLMLNGAPIDIEPPGITLRMALRHLAGFQSYQDGQVDPVPPLTDRHDPAKNTGFHWALDRWTAAPLLHRPQSEFHYTTLGYNLAGAAIGATVATEGEAPDAAYHRAIKEMLAGTGAAGIRPDIHLKPEPDRAQGYLLLDSMGVAISRDEDVSWKAPGGGFQSTTAELAEFCALFMGSTLLGDVGKSELWATPKLPDGQSSYYALGFGVDSKSGRLRVEHNGGQERARTRLVAYPEEGLCFVVMTNTETASDRFPIDLTPLTEQLEELLRQ
jgi:serine beta-lactamase-like protein LACTB, mitochondrial